MSQNLGIVILGSMSMICMTLMVIAAILRDKR